MSFAKSIFKLVLMRTYCAGFISLERCQRIYDFFRLARH